MTPPKLPADAPVANVIKPHEPSLFVLLGYDLELSVADGIGRALGHAIAVDIPLGGNHGLENISRSGAQAETHLIRLLANVQPLLLKGLLNGNTSVVAHHTLELRTFAVDGTIGVEDGDELQVVTLTTFVIVGIMSRGNLHSTGTKLHVNKIGVLNDGDATTVEGVNKELAMQMLVARILGVDGNGGVTQHGFETSRGDGNLLIGILNGVRERREGAKLVTALGILWVALVSLDLEIRSSLQIDVVHLNV